LSGREKEILEGGNEKAGEELENIPRSLIKAIIPKPKREGTAQKREVRKIKERMIEFKEDH